MARDAKLLFFWDYDTQWGADRSRSGGGAKSWGHLEFSSTERLLDLHAEYQVPACFAVVGAAALPGTRPYHDPSQIRRIHAAGHEVGSHSFHHDWLPGLQSRALMETLRKSKDAIEQCIGADVVSFVPPFNQPFDYPERLAFSLSERREVRGERTDLSRLCEMLGETGFNFCRVAYRPLPLQLAERLLNRKFRRPSSTESIAGVTCVRLNTPGGFDSQSIAMLERCVKIGGIAVVYGHPHAIGANCIQNESYLVGFLQRVQQLHKTGRLEICLPRDLLNQAQAAPAEAILGGAEL